MMAFKWLFLPRFFYRSRVERRKARFLMLYAWAYASLMFMAMVGVTQETGELPPIALLFFPLGVLLPVALIYVLVNRGRQRIAALVAVVVTWVAMTAIVYRSGVYAVPLVNYSVVVILAAMLLRLPGLLATLAVTALAIVAGAFLVQRDLITPMASPFDPVLLSLVILSFDAFILWFFSTERDQALAAAHNANRRLRLTSQIGAVASTKLDLTEGLDAAVDLIQAEFALQEVQIWLVDENRRSVALQAGRGPASESMLDRAYRVVLSEADVVALAVSEGETVWLPDASVAEDSRRRLFFEHTGSELVAPLEVGGQIIGVLDVHSAQAEGISPADIKMFEGLADQLAVAVENARLFADQVARAQHSEAQLHDMQGRLQEIENLNRQLTQQAWEDHLRAGGQDVLGITLQQKLAQMDTAWTPGMILAVGKQRPVISQQGQRQLVSVPVRLRGAVIGAIEIEGDVEARAEEVLEVTEAVADRLAVTVENVRLVEQSQWLADREFQVSEIAATLQSQTTVEEVLAAALTELGQVLQADRGSIRLGMSQAEATLVEDDV